MRLTLYTDYSLRVLIYLAQTQAEQVTISELAEFYKVSRSHLVKVVHNLGIQGYLTTTRGKGGGLKLAMPAHEIVIGEVVRKMEPDFELFECFNRETDQCVITQSCSLKGMFYRAQQNFLNTLDQHTIADAVGSVVSASPEVKPIRLVF